MSDRWYLIRTMTGEVGALLDGATGTWSDPLNGYGDLKVVVSRARLAEVERSWWAPWSGGLLVTRTTPHGEQPVYAGPITAPPEEAVDTVTLTAKGLGAILERREVLARDFAGLDPVPSGEAMSELARSVVPLTGRSLGTIMQDIVTLSTRAKVGGQLPIRFASPREVASTLNQRTYLGHNLANISCWKLLTELSEVINGPDFHLRAEWAAEDRSLIRWALHHGTAAQPTIAQDWVLDIDTTAPKSVASGVSVKADAKDYANRVYWTGAGEGEGVIVRVAQAPARLATYEPLLESVGSTSDSDNPDLIQEHAAAALAAGGTTVQVSLSVDSEDVRAQMGLWRVGDLARVTVAGWLNIPDGTHLLRIISASGTSGDPLVALEFQPDTVA